VLWTGQLATDIFPTFPTIFWGRLGYVVEVRTVCDRGPAVIRWLTYESIALNGFASLQVQKMHCAQCVRVSHTDSAIGGVGRRLRFGYLQYVGPAYRVT
jgi:hypothetical protein